MSTYEFNDTVEFSTGDTVQFRREQIGTRQKFKKYFDGAEEVFAITYSESPETILKLFDEFGLERLEVVVGNVENYQERLNGKFDMAKRLQELRREGRLVLYTCPSWGVHSKLYRIKKSEGEWILIDSSANLSKNGWGNQINMAEVWETDGTTVIDDEFEKSYTTQRDKYGDEFMDELVSRIEEADTDEEVETVLHNWVDGRSTGKNEYEELNNDMRENVDRIVEHQLVEESENADQTIAVESADKTDEEEVEFEISLQGYDDIDDRLSTHARDIDLSVTSNTVRTTTRGASQYVRRESGVPLMGFSENSNELYVQHPNKDLPTILSESLPEDLSVINDHLAQIEEYFETVDKYGKTNNSTSVKSHMYEALLWFFWAPFVNQYASVYQENHDLDKNLPFLYIHGESDAGKGTFAEFAINLISGGLVDYAQDADEFGKGEVKALRQINTVFPVTVDDITKKRVKRLDTLRKFWDKWTGDTDYPSIAFISNDNQPPDWFKNRAKILHFDVYFESTKRSEAEVNKMKDRDNKVFNWFAELMFEKEINPEADHDDTLRKARETLIDLYEIADRDLPDYFPETPADEKHDTGRVMWQNALEDDIFEFEEQRGQLIIEFEKLEGYEVKRYRDNLPTNLRAEKVGRRIIVKEGREEFEDWLGKPLNKTILSKVFSR